MKNKFITLAAVTCLSLANISASIASPGSAKNSMHSFNQVELTTEQKQEIRTVFKTAHENNSVYSAQTTAMKLQMQTLMAMPAWDEALARSTIDIQMQQNNVIELNKAKARNLAYNILNDEQKEILSQKALQRSEQKSSVKANGDKQKKSIKKRDTKGKNKKGKGKLNLKRLTKRLDLNEAQITQLKAINKTSQAQKQNYKESTKAYRAQMRNIIQASTFDEAAWLALQTEYLPTKTELKLLNIRKKYETYALLTAEQTAKMKKIMKKRERKTKK